MSKLAVVIKTRTRPGQRAAVYRLYEKHLAPRAAENHGQEVAAFCLDENDADVFYLFEIYASRAAFEQAGQQPWFWDYMQEAGPLLAGQPEVGLAQPAWAKGLPLEAAAR